jgi:hypothetical protein
MPSKWIAAALAGLCFTAGSGGCAEKPAKTEVASTESDYAIRLERDRAGSSSAAPLDRPRAPRALTFEMSGFAAPPAGAITTEARTAAMQAAVLDAFVKALIEARRSRGQTTADFTARMGPRLTITHRQIGDGYEAEVTLISRGEDSTFVVRDGVLQHPPHEIRLLRQVFEETNGEFSLLSTEWSAPSGGCQATVACYRPAGLERPSLAGDPTGATLTTP